MKFRIHHFFWLIGAVCLFFLLYFRLLESITRSYGADEYTHLHYVYLLTKGKVPYRDFFNIYSPIFHLTLYPIFKILGEDFLVLTLSRVAIFFYFLLGLGFTFGIGYLVSNATFAATAVLIAAALPIGIEKAIEVRPDNLMVPLFLGGVFFTILGLRKSASLNFFTAGLLFAMSFLVLAKIVFSVVAFILSIVIFGAFDKEISKRLLQRGTAFLLGAGLIVFLFFFSLFALGILQEAVYSIFVYSREIGASFRFGMELHPFFWFYPNDAVYGTYKGLSWYINNLIFVFFLIGIFTSLARVKKEKATVLRLSLFLPMIASFGYLFLVLRPFQQYLLPFLAFVPFWAAFGIVDLSSFLFKKLQVLTYLSLVLFFIGLTFSMWQSWQVKKLWTDWYDRQFIHYVLTRTKPADVFWGGAGRYVFRLDGYYVYHGGVFEFPANLKKKLPPFIPSLVANKTKYLLFDSKAIYEETWPFDQFELLPLLEFVKNNYQTADFPNLWVRKGW